MDFFDVRLQIHIVIEFFFAHIAFQPLLVRFFVHNFHVILQIFVRFEWLRALRAMEIPHLHVRHHVDAQEGHGKKLPRTYVAMEGSLAVRIVRFHMVSVGL